MRTLQRIGGLPPLRAAAAMVLALGYLAHSVSAAYFYVQESQDKCFIESVPTGVALTASYKNHENPGEFECPYLFVRNGLIIWALYCGLCMKLCQAYGDFVLHCFLCI